MRHRGTHWVHLILGTAILLWPTLAARPARGAPGFGGRTVAVRPGGRPVLVPQTGHSQSVFQVAFSPDGRTLATLSSDQTIILWDTGTGSQRITLTGHSGRVCRMAYSPDGRTLAVASGDGSMTFWDPAAGTRRASSQGHGAGQVSCLAFSPDGRTLASASYDKTIILWDVATCAKRATLAGHRGWVYRVAFSPDGRTLASASSDQLVILWDVATGEKRAGRGHMHEALGVAFSPDGHTLASASADGTVALWDANTGARRATLAGHKERYWVHSVLFAPDGHTLASTSDDKTVILWDADTGRKRAVLADYQHSRHDDVAFSPDGRVVAVGASDRRIILWDAATGARRAVLTGPVARGGNVVFSPDGRTLAAVGADNGAILWDAATGEQRAVLTGHTREARSVALSPDGRTLAVASADATIVLWDVTRGATRAVLSGHAAEVRGLAFSPDGRTLASASSDKTVALWDTAAGAKLATLEGHTFSVDSVAFSPDGRILASGSGDKAVIVWDVATGQRRATLTGHTETVRSVVFGRDGRTLASSSWDRTAILWDVATGAKRATLTGELAFEGAAFSPDGRTLALASGDKTVILWDAVTGQRRAALAGHTSSVQCVAFSPDGATIASGSWDTTVALWDAATGVRRATLAGHTYWVTGLVFSLDGGTLASASADGSVRVWDAATGAERATLYSLDSGQEYLAVTPQGYYAGSMEGARLVRWRVGGQLLPVEAYEARFRRPDLVERSLRGEALPAGGPDIADARPAPLVALDAVGSTDVAGDRARVRITVRPGGEGSRIETVELWANGRRVDLQGGAGARAVFARPTTGAGGARVVDVDVPFLDGEDRLVLRAAALDDQQTRGESSLLTLRRAGAGQAPGDLYVLSVGVSRYATPEYNLSFAEADARALSEALAAQRGLAFGKVETRVLADDEATAPRVRDGLRWVRESAGPNDVAIVFFAGHGVRGNLGRLFFFTHEGDLDALRDSSLPWTEVDAALGACRARQVVMLMDCCHAGAFGERRARADELADSLVKKAGVLVFASSRGDEESLESKALGHGAFTLALLQGLQGKADLLGKGMVRMSGLLTYVSETVAEMTGGRQHPSLPRAEQFDMQLVLARVR